jgi:hypothetical protein
MDSIVASLRLGWNALLFKEEAYEEMSESANPVVKGLILIVVVGVVIALFNLVGTGLEIASTPNLDKMQETIYFYMRQMPFWDEILREDPTALQQFEEGYNFGWNIARQVFAASLGSAAAGIISTPLGLVFRWLIYGLLAYLFARWLGGTGNLSQTLGALALAVAPQVINLLTLIPFVQVGSIVAVWGALCAYFGLKTVHKLSWSRALWATLLPFILVIAVLIGMGCLGTAILGAVIGGQS